MPDWSTSEPKTVTLTGGEETNATKLRAGLGLAALQAEGNFNTNTLTIEGSVDGVNFHPLSPELTHPGSSLIAPGIVEISSGVAFLKASLDGAGGSVTLSLIGRT